MTVGDDFVNQHDLETPDSIQVRFGLTYLDGPVLTTARSRRAVLRR